MGPGCHYFKHLNVFHVVFIFNTHFTNIYIYTLEIQRPLIQFNDIFGKKNIAFVGIYNQQLQGTIILMVFDLQGLYIYM